LMRYSLGRISLLVGLRKPTARFSEAGDTSLTFALPM
jgi:hypothetical protein